MRYLPLAVEDWPARLDTLRFGFLKWDLHVHGQLTVLPGALVLERREHEEAVRLAEGLADVAQRARRRLLADPGADALLGLPPAVAAAARAAPTGPGLTRIDLFRTTEGWVASEFNDDVPGGHTDALGLPAVLEDCVPTGLHVPGDLPDALVRLLAPPARDRGLPLAILHATGYAEDVQVAELVARLLAAADVGTVVASPAHLEWDAGAGGGTARVLGQKVAGAYRFFPAEWFPDLPNWPAWRAALAAGFPVTNDLAWAFTQSKAVFAWLHGDGAGEVPAHLRAALPWTAPLDATSAAAALERPDRFVLKPAYGRVGEGVVLGGEAPPEAWRKRVADALRSRRQHPFVVQRRFHAVPVEVAPGDARTACVGAYVADGRFAGYYSRLARGPLVAYDATNLLTLVEDA